MEINALDALEAALPEAPTALPEAAAPQSVENADPNPQAEAPEARPSIEVAYKAFMKRREAKTGRKPHVYDREELKVKSLRKSSTSQRGRQEPSQGESVKKDRPAAVQTKVRSSLLRGTAASSSKRMPMRSSLSRPSSAPATARPGSARPTETQARARSDAKRSHAPVSVSSNILKGTAASRSRSRMKDEARPRHTQRSRVRSPEPPPEACMSSMES
eukprot:scaffold319_cov244-Pinguiococcus_pyrenoidosus.AAC.27